MDVDHPECRAAYMTRYKDARTKSGLPETDESFMKYLGDDLEADLGF
jgi:aminoglycoside/choline kinase family phosphotransferase